MAAKFMFKWLIEPIWLVSTVHFAVGRLSTTTDVSDLSVTVNSSVTLPCETDTYQPIRWTFTASSSNQPQVMIYTGYPGQWREGFQQRFTESFNRTIGVSRLTINQVQLSDAGEYRCLEMNSSTHVIRFHLNVSDYGPMTTDDTTFRVVNVSESVTFRCTTNIMEPIRWFYTGSSTNQSIPKKPLIIYNGRTVRKELASRFNVNSSTGDSQLSIRSVEPVMSTQATATLAYVFETEASTTPPPNTSESSSLNTAAAAILAVCATAAVCITIGFIDLCYRRADCLRRRISCNSCETDHTTDTQDNTVADVQQAPTQAPREYIKLDPETLQQPPPRPSVYQQLDVITSASSIQNGDRGDVNVGQVNVISELERSA